MSEYPAMGWSTSPINVFVYGGVYPYVLGGAPPNPVFDYDSRSLDEVLFRSHVPVFELPPISHLRISDSTTFSKQDLVE